MKLGLGALALSVCAKNGTSPDVGFAGNDIRWTEEQVEYWKSVGVDTNGMKITPIVGENRLHVAGLEGRAVIQPNHSYHRRWKNPDGFTGSHLRIPYRFADGQFSDSQEETIRNAMNEMSDLVLKCIEFYDDTDTQLYAKGYIRLQSSSGGCWAQAGFVGHHSSYSVHQPINLSKSGCIHPMIITHEFLHALAMLHEQSRPDRDNFIVVHYDAIQSSYHSQYRKMPDGDWEDQKVKYDYWSVMHYPSYGFATGSDPTMTHIVTGEPVQKPRRSRVSTLDMIQLQKMYSEFCPNPAPTATCKDGKHVYLLPFACDGIPDCEDGSDEIPSACDQMCADKVLLSTHAGVTIDEAGVYTFKGDMHNSKYVYEHEWKDYFLYSNDQAPGVGNWHISSEKGSSTTTYYSDETTCPYGNTKTWFKLDSAGQWEEFSEMKVEIFEQIDFCGRENPCDATYETCKNDPLEAVCTFKADSCPVAGNFTTMEDCVGAICPTILAVEADAEPEAGYTIIGEYAYQGITNKRPGYKRRDGNKFVKGDEWIVFDHEEQMWTISEVATSDEMAGFNDTFYPIMNQDSIQLCPSTFVPATAQWVKASDGKAVAGFSMGNGKTACDLGTHDCDDTELCVADLATIDYSCAANPCQPDTCPGLGYTCAFDPNECPPEGTDDDTNEVVKIWHGEEDVATWQFIGGFREWHGDSKAMFDDKYTDRTMYHSTTCDGERGIVMNFQSPVKFVDIEIFTRGACCRDYRYQRVCLYADGQKFACTPDNQGDPGRTINFKDFLLDATKKIVGSQFKMMWDKNPAEDNACGQVEELFFHYVETKGGDSIVPSRGRRLGNLAQWGGQYQLQFDVAIQNALATTTNLMHVWAYDPVSGKGIRLPQIQVEKDSTSLIKIASLVNGKTVWTDVSLPTGKTSKVTVQQNYDIKGQAVYEIQVNGARVFSEVNNASQVFQDAKFYASSPWQSPASNAVIRNIHTSVPLEACGPTCNFDKADCPTAPVTWKGSKVGAVLYGSAGALQLKITIVNNKKPIDIRKNKYTGVLMFSKSKCGADFLKATADGRVKFDFFDKGTMPANMYETNFVYHYEHNNKPTAVVQFRQRKKSASPPVDLPPKNVKRDQFFLTISGLDQVADIPSFSKCFGKGGILGGVMTDDQADGGAKDWTRCIANQKPRA